MRFRDVALIVPVVGTFSLFASPVAYSVVTVPASTRTLLWFNPLSGVLEASRWSVFGGAVVFRRLERGFADAI